MGGFTGTLEKKAPAPEPIHKDKPDDGDKLVHKLCRCQQGLQAIEYRCGLRPKAWHHVYAKELMQLVWCAVCWEALEAGEPCRMCGRPGLQ